MSAEALAVASVAATCLVLLAGYPVAAVLAGVPLAFAFAGALVGVFDLWLLASLPSRLFGILTNEVLVAVPLFVLMGVVLERSAIAEDLLRVASALLGRVRGGLACAVTVVGALLAASTGIVGATVVTMGLLAVPAMLRAGYDPRLACGVVCAAGTLGQIIPPSIVLVILADALQGANAQAQLALGNFAPEPVSVVDLFAGALLPGLLLVALYLAWILVVVRLRPDLAPPLADTLARPSGAEVVRALATPVLLVLAVLGSILAGVATPSESAAFGAVGAIALAASRRRLDRTVLRSCLERATQLSAMIFFILVGASIFSLVFRGFGGDRLVHSVLTATPGGSVGALLVVMIALFLLGFFLDFVEIVYVVVPVVGPVLIAMGIDPVWLGVMMAVNLQTSFLTPPVGYALFYLQGVVPSEVKTIDVYRGVVPFVLLQLGGLVLVAAFPGLATWLPAALFG
ncbi:C4-dicarboxylate TRAP transporter large permease protein DctM [bacterium HR40]|nr:C4-dicarboxylate TRAP transporter large permease protein DctM [bacterium HR40]